MPASSLLTWAARFLAPAALTWLIAAGPAYAACKSVGSPERPVPYEQVQEIPGRTGPFRFRKAVSQQCDQQNRRNRWPVTNHRGLMDESGRRVLVPAQFMDVVPIDESTALVRVSERGWSYFDFGRGVRGESPYHAAMLYGGEERDKISGYLRGELVGRFWRASVDPHPTPTAWRSPGRQEAFPTIHIFAGGAEPLEFRQVEAIEVIDEIAVVHFFSQGEAGRLEQVSRIFTRTLREPRSPVIARVSRWQEGGLWSRNGAKLPYVLISRSLAISGHPLYSVGHLHIPIAADGTPLPLPEGVIGVIPIADEVSRGDTELNGSIGWVLAFADPSGLTLSPVHAPLVDALAGATTAPRWHGADLSGYQQPIPRKWSALRDAGTGQWQLFDRHLRPMQDPIGRAMAGHRFVSAAEAGAAYTRAVEQNRLATEAERLSREQAHRDMALAQDRGRIQAQGICAATALEIQATDVLERHFRECVVSLAQRQKLGSRVSAEARWAADKRADDEMNAYYARIYAERDRNANAQQTVPSAEAAWAQGVAAAQYRIDTLSDAVLKGQQSEYMRNMCTYNGNSPDWRPDLC